jgi:predicted DCC family thiol-disulfide oxidoreductase YuxK
MLPDSEHPILFFDGLCNLCNQFVQVVIKHDKQCVFRFSSLQSSAGQQVQERILKESGSVPDSLVLLYKGRIYIKSAAALKTASLLKGVYSVLTIGYIFPRPVRDAIYDIVAKYRYKWFGRRDECMIPTPELQSRFLD